MDTFTPEMKTPVITKPMPIMDTFTPEMKTPDVTKTMPIMDTFTPEMKTPVITKTMPMPKTYNMPATYTMPNTFPYPTYTNPSVTTYGNPAIPFNYPTMTYGANMMPRLKCIGTTCFY